jgi:signal transduction histidine kinase/DNA-binding response OmpR family regulator
VIKSKDLAGHVLKKSLIKTDKLEFRHNQFPFYLEFSSIDFRLDKNVEFAYKLNPSDSDWNLLKDPEIQFLNLPPGNYTLQVNGFSRGKEWEQKPLEINLDILPPWWATWWAYILYTLIAIAFADRFYRFQLSRKLALAESVRLTDLDQLKSNLYTNITHEFRTPLTVILGMSNTLKSNIEDKELENAEKTIEMIERNGNNLLRLVNELLDLAKLENEKMDLNFVKGDIIPFIKYLSESFHSMTDESHIKLTVYAEIDTLIVDYDVDKLSAIIYNLISNAIKFSNKSEGKIIVHINHIIEKEKEKLILKIKDNGIGIAKENLQNIFNRFYQVNASESRSSEGTGIGLALTKELVSLMGGNIEVKSELHKGSEFIVELPITRNALVTKDQNFVAKPEPLISTAKNNIEIVETIDPNSELPLCLIIEDNHDVAHYLETCLKDKYQTIHALNGIKGIEIALEKVPDIIICDVMMPGKDGYEVCKTLKTDERTDHIPIIILTAKVTMKDRLTGLSHGADAYLTKPFVKAELFTRLDQLIGLRKKMLLKMENNSFSTFLNKKAEDPKTKFLQKIIEIIHQEIDNHEFGSRHLAFKLHLSESQVYRKLKAITSKSTAVFIRTVRLQRAKELLQATNKTISEIAYEVGFNDPSWFSRAFKEEFGFSPSEISK